MKDKIIKKILILLVGIILAIFNTCEQNPFLGIGEQADIKFPTVSITSHSNNDIIRGSSVKMSGTVWDDIGVKSVILYRFYIENGEQKNEKVATGSIKDNKSWTLYFDSTKYSDGGNVFKIIVQDNSGKSTSQNINLYIDNYGPEIVINRPEAKSTDVYFNPFQVVIVPIDIGSIKKIEWELYIENTPSAKIVGEETNDIIVNKSYTFIIDPSNLPNKTTPKFSSGYCILAIRGMDDNNQYSRAWKTKRMFFNFGNDIPQITIASPDATNDTQAQTYGSDVMISGFSEDDDAVGKVVVRVTNIGTGTVTDHTIDYSSNPKKQQPVVLTLTGLTEDTYKFKAKAIDIYGIESLWTDEYYFKVKTSLPNISWTNPEVGSWQKGTINITATITSPSNQIKRVERKVGEGGTWVIHADNIYSSSYNFSHNFNTETEIPNGGEAKFYLKVTDTGNDSVTSYIIFFVDNVLPQGTIENPPDPNSGLNQTVIIQGTATDQIGGGSTGVVKSVIINIVGIGDVTPDGIASWSYNFDTTTVPNGSKLMTVTITDMADNQTQLTRTLNIDQSADIPQVSVTNLSNGDKIYGMFDIAGEASDDDAVKDVWIKIDNSGSNPYNTWFKASGTTNWTYRLDTSLYTVGAHTLYYKAVDLYSKESQIGSINFEIDPDLPVITFKSHNENDALGISTNKDVTGDVIKTNGKVSSIEIRLQGTNYTQDWTTTGLTVIGIGTPNATFSYTINPATYGEGPISVSIRAKDDLDKVNTSTINLVIDTVRPNGSLSLPVAGSIYIGSDGDGSQGITGNLIINGACNDSVPSSGLYASDILLNFENLSTHEIKSVIDGTPAKQIQGSVTNWTFNWDIEAEGPSLKDGLYKAILIVRDRAGNQPSSSIEVTNIMISRYRPTFSDLKINNIPVSQNMYVVKNCNFTGTLIDNNANDIVKGVSKIELYLSDDNIIDSGDGSAFASQNFSGSNSSENFNINYTFTSKKNYIIYRAIDKVGGIRDYPLLVNIDFNLPTQQFKYSSREYYPATQSSNPGYTASVWIKLDATDDNDISGSTIKTKLGTTSGGEEIAGLQTYTIGDIMKVDLKEYTNNPIYLWYSLKDRAGNQKIEVLNITRDASLPSISSAILNVGYLKDGNISGTASGGGSTITKVMISEISEVNSSLTKNINELDLFAATGTTNWSYTIPGISVQGDYQIVAYVVTDNSTNWYEKFNFTYDTNAPTTDFHVAEIDGSNNGRVYDNSYIRGTDKNNISGTVRFYGIFNDNFTQRYSTSDITIEIDLDTGTWTSVTNKTKNPDGTFNWYYDYNSQTHTNKVKNGATFKVRAIDKAGNISTEQTKILNIKPYITTISEVIGRVTPVIKWDLTESIWTNINDNESYTYRLSSGNITINGFNLNASGNESIVYTKNSGGGNTWNVDIGNDSSYSFNLTWDSNSLTNGSLKVTVGGIDSNVKKIIIIKNYSATSYPDVAEMDMVLDDNNWARVIYQKHQTAGSGLYRFTETSEGVFARPYAQSEYITHGYNRFWFVNLVKDIGTPSGSQSDNKYYLFTCDSENRDTATKGIQLHGNNTCYDTLPGTFDTFFNPNIQVPNNDWADPVTETRRNRWRMAAANNQTGDPYLVDWNANWGNLVAKSDVIWTVWFSAYDSKMHYRRMNNLNNNSTKSPAGTLDSDSSIIIDGGSNNIKGMFPSITLDSTDKPVIACFDENAGDLIVYIANNGDPQNESDFGTPTIIDSNGVVGAYPDIKINGSNIHIAYQDLSNASLKYAHGTNINSMTNITIDTDLVPGYYTHLTLDNGKPVISYIAYGYLGTGNAIRMMRWEGTLGVDSFTDKTKWEKITLNCANGITENKVRGYITTDNKFVGFGKSNYPEFFREKP